MPPLQFSRERPAVLPLDDGRLLVIGSSGWLWNSRKGWTQRNDLPPEILSKDRKRWRTAAKLVRADGTLNRVFGMCWDAEQGKWQRTKLLPCPPSIETLTLPNGTSLAVGGQKFSPGEKFPTALDTIVIRPPKGRARKTTLSLPRIRAALTPLPDGRVLVTGGYRVDVYFYDHDKDKPAEEAEIIDPKSGAVMPGGRLVKARDNHGIATLPDGSVILAGGRDESNPSLPDVEIGTPLT